MGSVNVILLKYFKVIYFTNLVCTTKLLKYKSLEYFQLYGILSPLHDGHLHEAQIQPRFVSSVNAPSPGL